MCLTKIQSTFYLALIFFKIYFSSTSPTVTPVFNLDVMFCLSFFLETSLTAVANTLQSTASVFYLLIIILRYSELRSLGLLRLMKSGVSYNAEASLHYSLEKKKPFCINFSFSPKKVKYMFKVFPFLLGRKHGITFLAFVLGGT